MEADERVEQLSELIFTCMLPSYLFVALFIGEAYHLSVMHVNANGNETTDSFIILCELRTIWNNPTLEKTKPIGKCLYFGLYEALGLPN